MLWNIMHKLSKSKLKQNNTEMSQFNFNPTTFVSVELFYHFSLILVTLNTFQAIHTEISCSLLHFIRLRLEVLIVYSSLFK